MGNDIVAIFRNKKGEKGGYIGLRLFRLQKNQITNACAHHIRVLPLGSALLCYCVRKGKQGGEIFIANAFCFCAVEKVSKYWQGTVRLPPFVFSIDAQDSLSFLLSYSDKEHVFLLPPPPSPLTKRGVSSRRVRDRVRYFFTQSGCSRRI